MIVKIYRKRGKKTKRVGGRGLTLKRIVLHHNKIIVLHQNKKFRGTRPKMEK
jgi:hypothetical protein